MKIPEYKLNKNIVHQLKIFNNFQICQLATYLINLFLLSQKLLNKLIFKKLHYYLHLLSFSLLFIKIIGAKVAIVFGKYCNCKIVQSYHKLTQSQDKYLFLPIKYIFLIFYLILKRSYSNYFLSYFKKFYFFFQNYPKF